MIYDQLGLKYEYYDPNPVKDNKEHSDCTVRALTKLLKEDWNDAYDELASAGKISGNIMNHADSVHYLVRSHDYDYCEDFADGQILVGDLLSKIKNNNIECIVMSESHAIYFNDDTIYDRNSPEEERGVIDNKSKLYLDYHMGENVTSVIASDNDMEKILDLISNKDNNNPTDD